MSIHTSPSIKEIATAMNVAQTKMHGAHKNSANPFFKSSYANLESVMDAIREATAGLGISYMQLSAVMVTDNGPIYGITTRIMHVSGEWIEGFYPVICAKQNDPQAFGSATTYARRYALSAAFGVVQVDDDGEGATYRNPPPPSAPPKSKPANKAPAAAASSSAPGDYIPKFGQYRGTKISAIGKTKLLGYVDYLESGAESSGQTLTGQFKEFVDNAEAYLAGEK